MGRTTANPRLIKMVSLRNRSLRKAKLLAVQPSNQQPSRNQPSNKQTGLVSMMAESRHLPVPDGLEGQRVDAAVARMVGISRTKAAEIADAGGVQKVGGAGGGRTLRRSDRLEAGWWIEVQIPEPPTAAESAAGSPAQGGPEDPDPSQVVDLPILYSDADIIVVDKPVGVAVHPSVGWSGPTILASLAAQGFRISTSGMHERQGVVHRLDVGTTGVLVVAASERAYTHLKRAFKYRDVEKRYSALVQGFPDPRRGTIDAPIGRHPGHDYRYTLTSTGRASVTHYDTAEVFPRVSLLDIRLETGRTHQIRVHMAAVGHPVVGDDTYGSDPVLAQQLGLTRQWLHARQLSFTHPESGEQVSFTSDYPADLAAALQTVQEWDYSGAPPQPRRRRR